MYIDVEVWNHFETRVFWTEIFHQFVSCFFFKIGSTYVMFNYEVGILVPSRRFKVRKFL